MYNRPYLTYDEQINRLIEKNVKIDDKEFVNKTLRTHSYYTLVNGYKDLFTTFYDTDKKMEVFTEEINFISLYSLYIVDTNLNSILFKYILQVERALKTKVAYLVANKFGVHETQYLDYKNYRTQGRLDRLNEMRNLKRQLRQTGKSPSVDHYRSNHNHIPPWIAVNCFYFGSVINWYKILYPNNKIEIANEFLSYFSDLSEADQLTLLPDCLSLLQTYRNNMAHGNRTFETVISTELPKIELLKAVPQETLAEDEFLNNIGKKDLFSVMLALFILTEDAFMLNNLMQDLDNLFSNFTEDKSGNPRYVELSPKGDIFQTLDVPNDYHERLWTLWSHKYKIPIG